MKKCNNDAQALCRHYYQLIQEAAATGWFDVAGHLDVIRKHNQGSRYFDETSPWYKDLIQDTLNSLAKYGMQLEINMNGMNHTGHQTYPGPVTIQTAREMGIPLVLVPDANAPDMQAQFFKLIQDMKFLPTP